MVILYYEIHSFRIIDVSGCNDKFVDKSRSLDWAKVTSVNNVNGSWKRFHEIFLQWFTGDILRSTSVRDKAWKQYREQKTSDNFTEYK